MNANVENAKRMAKLNESTVPEQLTAQTGVKRLTYDQAKDKLVAACELLQNNQNEVIGLRVQVYLNKKLTQRGLIVINGDLVGLASAGAMLEDPKNRLTLSEFVGLLGTPPEIIEMEPITITAKVPPVVCEQKQETMEEQPSTQPQGENEMKKETTFWSSVRTYTVTPVNTHVVQPVWAGKYGIKAGYAKVAGWTKTAWNWITATTLKRETSCALSGGLCVAAAVITPLTIAYSIPFIAVPYAVRGAVYSYTPIKNFIVSNCKKATHKIAYFTSPKNNGFSCFNDFAFSCCE